VAQTQLGGAEQEEISMTDALLADLNFTRPEPSINDAEAWVQWAAERYDIPANTLWAIHRYVAKRLPPGGFLSAVFRHDLFGAVFHADGDNLPSLQEIVLLVHNHIPAECHGSSERIRYWLEG
jgi:hypothetical protein